MRIWFWVLWTTLFASWGFFFFAPVPRRLNPLFLNACILLYIHHHGPTWNEDKLFMVKGHLIMLTFLYCNECNSTVVRSWIYYAAARSTRQQNSRSSLSVCSMHYVNFLLIQVFHLFWIDSKRLCLFLSLDFLVIVFINLNTMWQLCYD